MSALAGALPWILGGGATALGAGSVVAPYLLETSEGRSNRESARKQRQAASLLAALQARSSVEGEREARLDRQLQDFYGRQENAKDRRHQQRQMDMNLLAMLALQNPALQQLGAGGSNEGPLPLEVMAAAEQSPYVQQGMAAYLGLQ